MFLEHTELERCNRDLPVYSLVIPYKFFERLEEEPLRDIIQSLKTTAGDALDSQLFPRVVVSPEAWLEVMIQDTKKQSKAAQKLLEELSKLTLDKDVV